MSILHLSFDYPDNINQNKTKAIQNLIKTQLGLDSYTISMNRTLNFFNRNFIKFDHGMAITVFGLPYGILLVLWMFLAYKKATRIIDENKTSISIIHAHKLTFEGIIAFLLARKYNVPFIISFRGISDLKVLRNKPFHRFLFKRIVSNAAHTIFIAPWPINEATRYLGTDFQHKLTVIPNIVNTHQCVTNDQNKQKRFISAFHLDSYKRKNIRRVIKAFDKVFNSFPEWGLDIIGGGESKHKIQMMINASKHDKNFRLIGPIEHEKLLKMYSQYTCFILPSFPETFGLVFVEALAAGIPIIYSKDTGIDGLFNDDCVGIGVHHKNVNEIAEAIMKIIENHKLFIENVNRIRLNGKLFQFSETAVGSKYSKVLESCMKRTSQHSHSNQYSRILNQEELLEGKAL